MGRQRLAECRKALGLTQEKLAARIDVDPRTVRSWESGATSPQPFLRLKLAHALKVTPDRLAEFLAEAAPTSRTDAAVSSSAVLPVVTLLPASGGEPVSDTADGLGLLDRLDHSRLLVDQTLATSSTTAAYLDLIEERVMEHLADYVRTPPLQVLAAVAPVVGEVRTVAQHRQPARVQARLSEITAVLALLSADALMKLGEVDRARHWYGTARHAADDTTHAELQARVRAQETMLSYYYGRTENAVALARAAQALVPHTACSAGALAAAAEARALARLGQHESAEQAMNRARHLVDALEEPAGDRAFQFGEKRLLLYMSGTLTAMGKYDRARRVQDQALNLYRRDPQIVIDPTLIALDQAVGEAAAGYVEDACQRAVSTIGQLPAGHRTKIVVARAKDVVHAIPGRCRDARAVGELRELVSAPDGLV